MGAPTHPTPDAKKHAILVEGAALTAAMCAAREARDTVTLERDA